MTKYTLGDLIKECKEKIDRSNNPYEYFIAGDHMESERLKIEKRGRFADSDVGPAFIRLFKPGQVLYGSRRTYLKKVSVPDFEGVTSNVTFVLETKDENILPQALVPFLLLSDRFTAYSINKSKGSTNPYVLFSDLARFEIDLPPVEQLRRITTILCSAEDLKERYRLLLKICDNLVKSQFIEMFGDLGSLDAIQWETRCLKDVVGSIESGKSLICGEGSRPVKGYGVLKLSALSSGQFLPSENKVIDEEQFLAEKAVAQGDLLLARKNTPELVGACVLARDAVSGLMFPDIVFRMHPNEICDSEYLLHLLGKSGFSHNVRKLAHGTAKSMSNISKTSLENLLIPIPPKEAQQAFAGFTRRVDKSKFLILYIVDETLSRSVDQPLHSAA